MRRNASGVLDVSKFQDYRRLPNQPDMHTLYQLPMEAIPSCHIIPGTGFVVDFFKFSNPSVPAYFLSHAHAGNTLILFTNATNMLRIYNKSSKNYCQPYMTWIFHPTTELLDPSS